MNLTTPPPVEELDPQYVEDLRAELVRNARSQRRQWSAWTPVLASACAVAVIAGGVVASTRSGGSSPVPVGTPTTTERPAPPQKVPAGSSERVNLDLGSANAQEAVALAKQCVTQHTSALGEPNSAKPADVDNAVEHSSGWVQALAGDGGKLEPAKAMHLVQTFTTKTGIRVQCLDGKLLQSFDPVIAGVSWVQSRNLNAATPLNGRWTFSEVHDGGTGLLFVDFNFSALPTISRVEIRIRWPGGASPWYGVTPTDGSGYVEASQVDAVHDPQSTVVDYRAIDFNDRVVFNGVEYG